MTGIDPDVVKDPWFNKAVMNPMSQRGMEYVAREGVVRPSTITSMIKSRLGAVPRISAEVAQRISDAYREGLKVKK
jgi:hypothetical protein